MADSQKKLSAVNCHFPFLEKPYNIWGNLIPIRACQCDMPFRKTVGILCPSQGELLLRVLHKCGGDAENLYAHTESICFLYINPASNKFSRWKMSLRERCTTTSKSTIWMNQFPKVNCLNQSIRWHKTQLKNCIVAFCCSALLLFGTLWHY